MEKVGPLIHLWSMRFESKHRESKITANAITSRKNICLTLSHKHQLKLAYTFFSNTCLLNSLQFGRVINLSCSTISNIKNNIDISSDKSLIDNLQNTAKFVSWVEIKGTRYKRDMCLALDFENIPIFVVIKHILFFDNQSNPYFLCHKYITLKFSDHAQCWEVTDQNIQQSLIFTPCNTIPHFINPCSSYKNTKGTVYITFKQ